MKPSELKDKSRTELLEEEQRLRRELFDARFQHGTRQLSDTASIRRLRRDLARVLTFITQKAS